ncbi:MAG: sensor histidine kinase, partial [Nitrospinota bacterium]
HGTDAPIDGCPHARALESKRPQRIAADVESLGGVFEFAAQPILSPEGEVTGIVHTVRDITELQRAQAELRQSHEVLGQAWERLRGVMAELHHRKQLTIRAERLAALAEIVAGAAHEILNPVNIISIHSQGMLMHGGLPQDVLKKAETIEQQVRRIARVCESLRSFSRQTPPRYSTFSLKGIVEETLALLSPELLRKKINWEVLCDAPVQEIRADRDQLAQVVINLAINARDAMPEGGDLTLRLDPIERDGEPCVRLSCQDTGCGIPKGDLKRIFEPFFSTKEEKGTGMGLAVCHGIITAHGGTIEVVSTPGEGTTLTVELPLSRPRPSEEEPSNGTPAGS